MHIILRNTKAVNFQHRNFYMLMASATLPTRMNRSENTVILLSLSDDAKKIQIKFN